MTFYSEDQLRKLGKEISDAAENFIADQNNMQNVTPLTDVAYESYPDLYASFATPDPAAMQPALNALGNMSYILDQRYAFPDAKADGTPVPQVDKDGLAGTKTPEWILNDLNLGDWHGSAKDAFQSTVLNGLMENVRNQKGTIRFLVATLSAEMNMRNTLNQDVWNIGQATLKTLNQSPIAALKSAHGQFAITCLLALVNSWNALGAAVAEAEMTVGGITTLASGINTVATGAANSPDSIDNRSIETIDSSMKKALTATAKAYTDQQKKLNSMLDQVGRDMADPAQIQLFEFPLPWTNLDQEQLGDETNPKPGTLEDDFRNH
jgi:hypothetical protein